MIVVCLDHPITLCQLTAYADQRLTLPRRVTPLAVVLGSGLIGVAIRPHYRGVSVQGTYPTMGGILAFLATFGLLHIVCQPQQEDLEREVGEKIKREIGSGK